MPACRRVLSSKYRSIAARRDHHHAGGRNWFLALSSARPRYINRTIQSRPHQMMTSLLSRYPGTRHESSVQYPATRPKSLAGSARGSLGFYLKPGPTIRSMFVDPNNRYDLTRFSMDITSRSSAGIRSESASSLPLRAISRDNLSAWYAQSSSWASFIIFTYAA
jgi:hypothetical protein